uniref:Zinc finger, CCHC-type, retrotransposon Gag domain protein n=1 Tax=Tanacetum cinerariifolium TaxID=118510 RepID=A0A699K4R3_TANCI|nr:hypothetical protein [Tanacetum cinerariifolium]
MVNTRQSTSEFLGLAFDEAVQQAVNALLHVLTAQITNKLRQNGAGGNGDQPSTIHTWLERFGKQKPRSFSSATTPVDAENWIAHIEKMFEVLGYADEFKLGWLAINLRVMLLVGGRLLNKPGEEKHMWQHCHRRTSVKFCFCNISLCLSSRSMRGTITLIVRERMNSLVANAGRNIELLHERDGSNNKRKRDGDYIQPAARNNNQKGYDQRRSDGYGYDRHNNNQRDFSQRGNDMCVYLTVTFAFDTNHDGLLMRHNVNV